MRKQEVIKAIAETIARHKIMIDKSYPEPCPAYVGAIGSAYEIGMKLNLDRSEIEMLSEEIYFNQK